MLKFLRCGIKQINPDAEPGVNDINVCEHTIRRIYYGYPYIAQVIHSSSLDKNTTKEYPDGFDYLDYWISTICKDNARYSIERTLPGQPLNGLPDWDLNEFGSDSLFVAFKDERDYIMFLLKWETSVE